MYDYLEGRVASRAAARLVIDVAGVGYELSVPLSATFPAGERTRVWTHLVVREDAHLLYGFADAATRDVFRALLTVRGVGPAVALGILSGLSRQEFVAAIQGEDVHRLMAVRGVGRKTAEQVLLDLRGKAALLAAAGDQLPAAGSAAVGAIEDAIGALISIGYPDKEARKAVERAAREVDKEDLEQLVRVALQGSRA